MTRPLIEYARRGLPLRDVPVFDCHAHIGRMNQVVDVPLADRIAEADRLGIDLTAISSTLAIAGDIRRGNRQVADAIRRYPDRFIGYCHVSARFPELILPELKRCFAIEGFRGIKAYQVGVPYDDPLFEPAWEFAAARKAPVLAHTWGGELSGLDHAAARHRGVAFIAAHAGSAFAYASYIAAAQANPNLYLDLTYSREHTNMIEELVGKVGADRIVWGTDTPLFSMAHQISKVLFAQIDDADKRKILYTTAAGLFRLPVSPPRS
jgi:predicted TIM-barrel fold metal-dependent hydrolase